MLKHLLGKIEAALAPASGSPPEHDEHVLRLAAAVLMVEVTRADHHIAPEEEGRLIHLIQRHFGLDRDETVELIALARHEAGNAVALNDFTRRLTDGLEVAERAHIVELLWELAMADDHIDRHEEHLIRQVSDWLYVPHASFVRAKHRAARRHESNQAGGA